MISFLLRLYGNRSLSRRRFTNSVVLACLLSLLFFTPLTTGAKNVSIKNKPTIAVLRFKNESQTDRLVLFETGLPQMIISDLANISSINVVERERIDQLLSEVNISDAIPMDDVTVQKAGKALGADYLLKGIFNEKIVSGKPLTESILTISVQIFDVSANKPVKQVVVQGKSDKFFKLEKDIVQNVIMELKILITEEEKVRVEQVDVRSLEAQLHYLKGWETMGPLGDDEEAIKKLKMAIYLDPDFELAYHRLAGVYSALHRTRNDIEKAIKGYEELIKKFPKSKYMVDYLCALAFTSYQADRWLVNKNLYHKKAIWALTKRLEEYTNENFLLRGCKIEFYDPGEFGARIVMDKTPRGCAIMLRECYYKIGEPEKAKEVHEKWLGSFGFGEKVNYYTNKKEYGKVIELCQEKINENKNGDSFVTYETLHRMGKVYYDKLKDNEKALESFRRALTYLPPGETAFRDRDGFSFLSAPSLTELIIRCFDDESVERINECRWAINFYLNRNIPRSEKRSGIKKSFYLMMDTYHRRKDIDGAISAYEEIKALVADEDIVHLGYGERFLEDWLIKTGRRKKDETWIAYDPQEETNFFKMHYQPTAVFVDSDYLYWGLGRGYEIDYPARRRPRIFHGCVLGKYLKAEDRWEMIPIPDEQFYDFLISQMLLVDGEIWLTCYPRGIVKYNISSGAFSFITTKDGLPSNSVHCLACVNNAVWFGFGEMDRYDRRADKAGGILRIDDTGDIIPYVDAEATTHPVTALSADGSLLWIGTSNGTISQFDTKTQKWRIMKKVSGEVKQIVVGEDDVWFACMRDGLYRYNQRDEKWQHYKHEYGEWKNVPLSVQCTLHVDSVNRIAVSGNKLWVSITPHYSHHSGTIGIDMLDIKTGSWQPLGGGVGGTFGIAIDQGEVWVASHKIMRYKKFKTRSEISHKEKIAVYWNRIQTLHKQGRDKEAISLVIEIWDNEHLSSDKKEDIRFILKEMDKEHSVKILLLESMTKGEERLKYFIGRNELWRSLHSELENILCDTLQSRDPIVRQEAAGRLGYVGSKDSIIPLVTALERPDQNTVVGVADALNDMARYANPELLALMRDEAVEPLGRQLMGGSGTGYHAAAALGKIGGAKSLDILLSALNNSDGQRRRSIVRALGEIGSSKAIDSIVNLLKIPDTKLQRDICKALGKIGGQNSLDILLNLLDNCNKDILSSIVWALGEIGNPKTVEPLVELLHIPDIHIKRAVCKALGKIGDKRAMKYIEPLLSNDNERVRYSADKALRELSKKQAK